MQKNSAHAASFIGVGGMFVAIFLYGYSAIALPSVVHSVLMPLLWLVLFAFCCASFTRHPYRAISLPVIAIAAWFAVMLTRG
jgi:hypothetical protein